MEGADPVDNVLRLVAVLEDLYAAAFLNAGILEIEIVRETPR